MLTSVDLEKYRGFGRYRIDHLGRVNLLVGRNNCGKTSVLEAVQLLVSGGDPTVLARTAARRGETIARESEPEQYRRSYDVSHFFHGHEFRLGDYFRIGGGDGYGSLTVRVSELEQGGALETIPRKFAEDAGLDLAYALKFEGAAHPLSRDGVALPVFADGALWIDSRLPRWRTARGDVDVGPRIRFITPDSLAPDLMTEMWDDVLRESRESQVVEAMRILEPRLKDISFLSRRPDRVAERVGVLVGFENLGRRLPLGTLGDGMRRLLALSLSLIRSGGGVLLIDEIDTGLHYSVMGDMWLLVASAAHRFDMQVFATTHSWDCVRGLYWLSQHHPEFAHDVSLQKIDPSLDESVALDADALRIAVEQQMEPR